MNVLKGMNIFEVYPPEKNLEYKEFLWHLKGLGDLGEFEIILSVNGMNILMIWAHFVSEFRDLP